MISVPPSLSGTVAFIAQAVMFGVGFLMTIICYTTVELAVVANVIGISLESIAAIWFWKGRCDARRRSIGPSVTQRLN